MGNPSRKGEAAAEYAVRLIGEPPEGGHAGVMLAVAGQQFADLGPDSIQHWRNSDGNLPLELRNVLPRTTPTCGFRLGP